MHIDPNDLEQLAVDTYRRAGLDPATPTPTTRLARMIFGPKVIVRPRDFAGHGLASSGKIRGAPRIAVSSRLPLRRAFHAVGHEIAHLLLGQPHGTDGADLEAACDLLGAALVAPRPLMAALHREHGFDIKAVAGALVATETCAALRLGEALELPLVSWGAKLRVRGPSNWQWPALGELERWRRRTPPGMRRVRVSDERGRTVLVAA